MAESTRGSNMDLLAGDWSLHSAVSYYTPDYHSAGYNAYLSKSIDLTSQAPAVPSDLNLSTPNQYADKNINYSNAQVTGALGDIMRVGNILLDGTIGRITIYDGSNIEVVRIGLLDDV